MITKTLLYIIIYNKIGIDLETFLGHCQKQLRWNFLRKELKVFGYYFLKNSITEAELCLKCTSVIPMNRFLANKRVQVNLAPVTLFI